MFAFPLPKKKPTPKALDAWLRIKEKKKAVSENKPEEM